VEKNEASAALELDLFFGMALAIEAEREALAFDARDEVYRTVPEGAEVFQGFPRIVLFQVLSVVLMREQELASVVEVGVHHFDDWIPEVGELGEEFTLHLPELSVENLPAIPLVIETVNEEFLFERKLGGEEGVDESAIPVVTPALSFPNRPLSAEELM